VSYRFSARSASPWSSGDQNHTGRRKLPIQPQRKPAPEFTQKHPVARWKAPTALLRATVTGHYRRAADHERAGWSAFAEGQASNSRPAGDLPIDRLFGFVDQTQIWENIMAFIEWQDLFETGIELVDEQHQKLFDMVNRLDALTSGQSVAPDTIDQAFGELLGYTGRIFQAEERIMRQVLFSEAARHVLLHKDMTNQLKSLMSRVGQDGDISYTELLRFVADWAVKHIMTEDQKIGREYARCCSQQSG
jgi:hemerythrin-like metal-binding protein